ncbi:MAG: SDR family oxidoreductase [Actinobacteria bacterium]|nr:SDR family oxidoreductase [Actinomycetota bacterium]
MSGFEAAHKGRIAVVTGAATGLGRAFAERLASDGAMVVAVDVDDADEAVAAIERNGGEAAAERCDVSSEAGVAGLGERVLERFGRCDILVNNAGAARNISWGELDFGTWRQLMGVNLDSMFLTCKAFAPAMAGNGFGRIINISSDTFGLLTPGFVHYIAAKGGVIGLTRGLATDLGNDGITVNAVLPGLTRTPNLERAFGGVDTVFEHVAETQAIKRQATPSDIEGAVSFLATEDAGWITGQSLVVDGGLLRL